MRNAGLDRSVTVRSSCSLPFVCNKTLIRGWGPGWRTQAEGRKPFTTEDTKEHKGNLSETYANLE